MFQPDLPRGEQMTEMPVNNPEDPVAWTIRTLREHILIMGLDEDVLAPWASNFALATLQSFDIHERRSALLGDPTNSNFELIRSLVVGSLLELLVRGEIQLGSITEGGFEPWRLAPGQAVERIMRSWLEDWPQAVPDDFEVFVAHVTRKGATNGRKALEKEEAAGLWEDV